MKYLLYCALFLAAVVILTNVIFRLIQGERYIEKRKTMRYKILLAVILVLIGSFGYLLPYQHAESEALIYATSTKNYAFEERKYALCFLNEGSNKAFIFYPGARVDEYAYCQLAGRLAEKGIDTYIVREPFHMAFFATSTAGKIIRENDYDAVYVGGHSLGGVVAVNYNELADGIILLASYPTKEIKDDTALLSIYGDRDGCLEKEVYDNSRQYWPDDAREVVIKGGNHACFGQYGFQKGDNEANIMADEQIEITVDEIISFVK